MRALEVVGVEPAENGVQPIAEMVLVDLADGRQGHSLALSINENGFDVVLVLHERGEIRFELACVAQVVVSH